MSAGSYHRSRRSHPRAFDARIGAIVRVWRNSCCPAFARSCPKIPFFCPAVDTRRGLISPSGAGKWGDCHMMVKASGRSALIISNRALCMFRRTVAGRGSQQRSARPPRRNRKARRPANPPDRACVTGNATRASPARSASKPADTKKSAEKDVADASGDSCAHDSRVRRQRQCATDVRRCRRQRQRHDGKGQHDAVGSRRQAGPAEAQGVIRCGRGFLRSAQRCRSRPAANPLDADGCDGLGQARLRRLCWHRAARLPPGIRPR